MNPILPRLTLAATAVAAVISAISHLAQPSERQEGAGSTDMEAWNLGRRHSGMIPNGKRTINPRVSVAVTPLSSIHTL